jgi:hypothetical protein
VKFLKGFVVVFVLAFVANWALEKWVLKDPADASDSGFVPQTPGLGMDDAARAAGVALVVVLGGRFVRSLLGGRKGG